jgi:hypothetical protein
MQNSIDCADRNTERSGDFFDSTCFGRVVHWVRSQDKKYQSHGTAIPRPTHSLLCPGQLCRPSPEMQQSPRSRYPLEIGKGIPQSIDRHIVEQSGEPFRASSASTPHLPDADHSETTGAAGMEISGFPSKERLCMPGSKTTQGRPSTRKSVPVRIAFHHAYRVGTLNLFKAFAAQWLAYRLPCQRFAPHLAMHNA